MGNNRLYLRATKALFICVFKERRIWLKFTTHKKTCLQFHYAYDVEIVPKKFNKGVIHLTPSVVCICRPITCLISYDKKYIMDSFAYIQSRKQVHICKFIHKTHRVAPINESIILPLLPVELHSAVY